MTDNAFASSSSSEPSSSAPFVWFVAVGLGIINVSRTADGNPKTHHGPPCSPNLPFEHRWHFYIFLVHTCAQKQAPILRSIGFVVIVNVNRTDDENPNSHPLWITKPRPWPPDRWRAPAGRAASWAYGAFLVFFCGEGDLGVRTWPEAAVVAKTSKNLNKADTPPPTPGSHPAPSIGPKGRGA